MKAKSIAKIMTKITTMAPNIFNDDNLNNTYEIKKAIEKQSKAILCRVNGYKLIPERNLLILKNK